MVPVKEVVVGQFDKTYMGAAQFALDSMAGKPEINFMNTFVPANLHLLRKQISETYRPVSGIEAVTEPAKSGGEIKRDERLVFGNDRLADLLNDSLLKGECGILGLSLRK